jgi:hypothetical protein
VRTRKELETIMDKQQHQDQNKDAQKSGEPVQLDKEQQGGKQGEQKQGQQKQGQPQQGQPQQGGQHMPNREQQGGKQHA